MKPFPIAIACAAALFVGAGCVTDNVKFPEPTANFTPKREYAVSHDKMRQAALDALDKNRIAVTSADKPDGIIRTDYIPGPGEVMIPLGISQLTRYRFNVTLRDGSSGTVKLSIFCTIEDSMSDTRTTGQWHDATSQNAALENKLEVWLYEQIEGELKASI